MAGSGDIKQRIVLEGEKEYSSSIKEAQRNLKTLRTELKAETAELGKNATEQQKAEVKTKNLQKQIAEQEKIVKANAKALQEVKEKYGDNADAVAKYEQKLNESRAALANMKNELEGTGDGFKSLKKDAEMATVAAKAVSDTIGNLASVGDTVASSIEGIFTGMLDAIRAAVGEVWTLIAETAAKANRWTDLANAYGTTADKVQRMTKGLEWSGGSFEDLMTIIQKVNWNGDKKENLLTNALGISDVNYTDKLDYTMLVLSKLRDLKATNGQKYDSIIEQVFGGKQGTRLSWFIDNWDTIQGKLAEYDEGGYSGNTGELSTMNEAYVMLQTIEGKWDSLKEKFAAGLGQVSLDIMTNVNGALDALSKYFNAETDEEREEALKELEKNIIDTFDTVKTAIETGLKKLDELAEQLKESDNPTVQAIGNIMGGLVDVLQWFTEDNMQNVVSALEILAGFWVGGKALSMIGNITQLASQIAILKGAGGLGSISSALGGLGAAGVAGAMAGSDVTAAIVAAAGPLASAIAGITMSVGLVALAVPVLAEIRKLIIGDSDAQKSEGEILLPEADKETQERVTQQLRQMNIGRTFSNGRDALHAIVNGDRIGTAEAVEEILEEDNTPKVNYTAPVYVPSPRKNAKFSVTQEQRDAAEAFWDVWRSGYASEEEYDSAYDAMEAAFAGNEKEFNSMVDWLGKLYDAMTENQNSTEYSPETWTDIPSTWWENQLKSDDISGFRGLPGQMRAAVQSGMNNVRVVMDGQVVGNLVAPYVSQYVARDMA